MLLTGLLHDDASDDVLVGETEGAQSFHTRVYAVDRPLIHLSHIESSKSIFTGLLIQIIDSEC